MIQGGANLYHSQQAFAQGDPWQGVMYGGLGLLGVGGGHVNLIQGIKAAGAARRLGPVRAYHPALDNSPSLLSYAPAGAGAVHGNRI